MKIIRPMLAEDSTIFDTTKEHNITSKIIWDSSYIMQPKFDGSRYILQWDEYWFPHLTSRTISVKNGLPVVKTHLLENIVFKKEPKLAWTILDWEIVVAEKGKSILQSSTSSFVNEIMLSKDQTRVIEKLEQYDIGYVVYDTISRYWVDITSRSCWARSCEALSFVSSWNNHQMWKFYEIPIFDNTEENLKHILDEWYEWAMLKEKDGKYVEDSRSWWHKVKRIITEDWVIMGWAEGTWKYKGTLWALIIWQYFEIPEESFDYTNSDFKNKGSSTLLKDGNGCIYYHYDDRTWKFYKLREVAKLSWMTDEQRYEYWNWLKQWWFEMWDGLWYRFSNTWSNDIRTIEFSAQEKTKERYRHPRFLKERSDKNYFECIF